MIRHSMDIVKAAVQHLNPGQTPVLAADQPLYALAKKIQWTWPATHGEDHFVIMFGGLHIEMATLKLLGDWLEDSGWTNALVQAEIASSGTANSFIHASHVTKTRHAHQVTAEASIHSSNKRTPKTAHLMTQRHCNQIVRLSRNGAHSEQRPVSTLTTGLRPFPWSFSCCGTSGHFVKVTSSYTWNLRRSSCPGC